jgi:hypothetical protein
MGVIFNGQKVDTSDPLIAEDQLLQTLDKREADAYTTVPSVDIKFTESRNIFKFVAQSFADNMINSWMNTPSQQARLVGKLHTEESTKDRIAREQEMFRNGDIIGGIKSIVFGPSYKSELQEKIAGDAALKFSKQMRNWELALRNHVGLAEEDLLQPENVGEQLVSGLGSGIGSMANMVFLSAVGYKTMGKPGAAIAPWAYSYMNEKTALSEQLMDAGYNANFVDKVSDLYAYPASALDFMSFQYLGKLLRPVAVKAITKTVSKTVTDLSMQQAGQIALAYLKGFMSEGATEAVQQRLQTEFEIANKLKDRSFAEDLTDDIVSFLVGGFIGGPAGAIGQIRARRATVKKMMDKYGMSKDQAGKIYNDMSLRAEILKLEELKGQVDVSESLKWVEKAQSKIDGTNELDLPTDVASMTEGGFEFAEGMLEQVAAEKVDKQVAKLQEKLNEVTDESERFKIMERIETLELKKESITKGDDIIKTAEAKAEAAVNELLELAPKEIPKFKNTQEAVAFGLVATTEQLAELQKLHDEASAEAKALREQDKLQEAYDKAVEAQFYREAIEGAEGASQHKDTIKKIKKSKKTRAELAKAALKAERTAEALRQERARIAGEVSLTPAQVKAQAIKKLRQVLNAYRTGIKMSEAEFKAVQKAIKNALTDSSLSDKAKARLLRQILSVRTAQQFNDKRAAIMNNVNEVVRSEKVKAYQNLAKRVLNKMLTDQVSPKNQVFAAHLKRVLNGKVPTVQEMNAAETTADMAKAIIEEAVFDIANAGSDIGTAARAFQTIKNYYSEQFQEYANFKKQEQETFKKLAEKVIAAVSNGVPLDAVKDSLDSLRQKAKSKSVASSLSATPYTISFMSILDMLDTQSGFPSMQGPLVKEFSSVPAFSKWVSLTGKTKEMIDMKGREIYGKNFLNAWMEFRGEDFLDVEVQDKDGNIRRINISRAGAMSLYLTTKMLGLRQDLLNMGISEAWLESFENGDNVNFTDQDYAWMQNVRDTLDYFADQIAPIYEKLTGTPFRRIDNYYMVQRYMVETLEDGSFADKNSVIDSMLKGKFQKIDPTNKSYFKQRTKSKKLIEMPDIFQAISSYAMDMNHFLAYAEYTVKLQAAFQRSDVKKLMERNLPAGIPPIIDEFINTLSGASQHRTADRVAMKGFFKLLGYYARNKIAPLKISRDSSLLLLRSRNMRE